MEILLDYFPLGSGFASFATYASLCPGGTCRPEFTSDGPVAVKRGRHPILAATPASFHTFVPFIKTFCSL